MVGLPSTLVRSTTDTADSLEPEASQAAQGDSWLDWAVYGGCQLTRLTSLWCTWMVASRARLGARRMSMDLGGGSGVGGINIWIILIYSFP